MLADRPYMRNTPSFPRWSSSATLVVLVVNLAVFVLQNVNHVYVQSPIERYLALSSAGLAHGYVWQLLTFQFLHWSFWHFFINSAMLFMFGRPVEMALGRGRFFEIYFFSGAMGGLLQGLLGLVFPMPFGLPTMGASAGVSGLLAMYCVLNRDQTILFMFVLPMRAWHLLIGSLLVAGFFVVVPAEPGIAHAAHLGGMLAAMGYEKWLLRRERRLFNWRSYGAVVRSRELVKTPSHKRTFWQKQNSNITDDLPPGEFISREVDPILDKISAHGIQSLTERERRILEAARAKMSKR